MWSPTRYEKSRFRTVALKHESRIPALVMQSSNSSMIRQRSHPRPVLSGQLTVMTEGSSAFFPCCNTTTSSLRTPMAESGVFRRPESRIPTPKYDISVLKARDSVVRVRFKLGERSGRDASEKCIGLLRGPRSGICATFYACVWSPDATWLWWGCAFSSTLCTYARCNVQIRWCEWRKSLGECLQPS